MGSGFVKSGFAGSIGPGVMLRKKSARGGPVFPIRSFVSLGGFIVAPLPVAGTVFVVSFHKIAASLL